MVDPADIHKSSAYKYHNVTMFDRVELYLHWMGRVASFTLWPHANRVTDTHYMGRGSLKTGLTIFARKKTSASVRNGTEGALLY